MQNTAGHIVTVTKHIVFLWICLLLPFSLVAQLANSNFGLRSKMGLTLNSEISTGSFEYQGQDLGLTQYVTNFQAAFPLILKIDTSSSKVRLNIFEAEYTFRSIGNVFSDAENLASPLLNEDFYANSLNLSYLHTIGFPWMMLYTFRATYAGEYQGYNPLNINASTFLLYSVNRKLTLGVGVLYQGLEDQRSFLVVPFMDWRISNKWFVDVTAPDRILVGRNFGKNNRTQLSWGTYLEFFTRFAFTRDEEEVIYENFDISSGLDFRTPLKGKLYFNAFLGNNFFKNIALKDADLDRITSVSAFSGLNARIGLSLNLEE